MNNQLTVTLTLAKRPYGWALLIHPTDGTGGDLVCKIEANEMAAIYGKYDLVEFANQAKHYHMVPKINCDGK